MLLRGIFSSFPQYFQCISNFRSQITYAFVKCGCSIYFSPNSANLICQGTDILKYFRESLGIRESTVYRNRGMSALYIICDFPRVCFFKPNLNLFIFLSAFLLCHLF